MKKTYKSPEIRTETLVPSTWACKVKPWKRKIEGSYVDIVQTSNLVSGVHGNEVGGGPPVMINREK